MSVLNLDAALGKFAERIGLGIVLVQRKLTLDIHTGITRRTPVDTGRARASWQIGFGAPDTSVPPPVESAAPRNKGNPRLTEAPDYEGQDINFECDGQTPTFVTSSLDYVEYLEEGTSQQAPAGMVAVTLAEEEAKIEQYLSGLL